MHFFGNFVFLVKFDSVASSSGLNFSGMSITCEGAAVIIKVAGCVFWFCTSVH